jgi:hypothetical protein
MIGSRLHTTTMSSDASRAPLLILIGIACVGASALLAWLSSPVTMRLERTGGQTAQVEQPRSESATVIIEQRLFGLIDIGHERIDGVRSATMVDSRMPGSSSHTPPHMVLETMTGSVNIGRRQQLFVRDFAEIKGFLEDRGAPPLTLSSIAPSQERVRFVVAQVSVLFLGLVGFAVVRLGFKSF